MRSNTRNVRDYINGAQIYLHHNDATQALAICKQGLQYYPNNTELLLIAYNAANSLGDQVSASKYLKLANEAQAAIDAINSARRQVIADKLDTASDVAGNVACGTSAVGGAAIGTVGIVSSIGIGAAGLGTMAAGAALTPGCGCILGIPLIILGVIMLAGAAYLLISTLGAAAALGAFGIGGLISAKRKHNKRKNS